MKSICMSCNHFKIKDLLNGYCRVEKKAEAKMVRHEDSCRKWIDCGQQYYIRLGWLKAQKSEKQ